MSYDKYDLDITGHVVASIFFTMEFCKGGNACLTADPVGHEFDPGPVPYFCGD